MANTTTNTFLKSLGQIALAALASWGAAEISNNETSWTPYRNQMVQNMAATGLSTAIQQYNAATTASAQNDASTGTAAQ